MTQRVLDWISQRLSAGLWVASATVLSAKGSVPGKPGAKLALTDVDDRYGTIGGAGLEMKVIERLVELLNSEVSGGEVITYGLNKGAKGYEVTALDSLCGGQVTLSLEVVEPMPHLLLMGGGHVAASIAEVCIAMGWDHSVQDTREPYAGAEAFPSAREHHANSVSEFFADEDCDSISRFSNILLLGHDWSEDEERLARLLAIADPQRGRPQIGVIGSRSKWQAYSTICGEKGIEQSLIDAVQCPIGLAIGAESPEEIAIAVVGQIIADRKGVDPSKGSWRDTIS
jgi:xanthine dehydrogenase accessory factor